ncbi:hypothetical protein AX17_001410 [Amanita inopinata Kibby_2008]|nr:hypothetical protein AX17_001410 [Amanita inopinata Kibby_2008]
MGSFAPASIENSLDDDGLEMSLHQRAIVDTCFEEGQHESAISVLEQLRSPSYRPSVSHVRQLIYIALHPPSAAQPDKTSKSIYDSPSKLTGQQSAKTLLSSSAITAAQQLLISFVVTQSPNSLARALPSYDSSNRVSTNAGDDAWDSDISRESRCIREAKDCWALLAEGFLSRGKVLFSTPKKTRRRRGTAAEDSFFTTDSQNATVRSIIGDSAWPLLDWLLTLFERDESLTKSSTGSCYSPLFLEQVPPTRDGSGGRWDTETPLAIVMYCLQQSDLRRQTMGSRLLTLLIHLVMTPFLDFPLFIASVFNRLSTATAERLCMLFSSLSPSLPVHRFKVALCYKFISELESVKDKSPSSNPSKPQARARKPHSSRRASNSFTSLTSGPSTANIKHLLPCQAVLRALESKNLVATDAALLLRVKFELLLSYGTIQQSISSGDRDPEWINALQQAKLNSILTAAFNSENEESTKYRRLAQCTVSMWTYLITNVENTQLMK